ncbi:flagellar basal body-associated FliL family protein [Clostridium aestuarii]|uniref:Flagellar protein FliL n=1 Tax=Clostridium aestuarii TaxID=338193 RepID=A0ABT4CXG7_9CLOT|nr:flagellar basal body-associated FliL family protein [Clostridium aestuarii]MCY6483692.1 flagellar basal body-associated FliL family protein [Clostridium aestuarii]
MSEIQSKSEKKANVLKIVIIVLLTAILVGGGAFAGYYFASGNKQKAANSDSAKVMLDQKTFSLDEFIVNLKSKTAAKYLKTTIYIGYANIKENKQLEVELKDKKPIMRDAVNAVLRSKTNEDFDKDGVKKLKEEIKNKVNPLLQKGKIADVYFSEIIVQ